jgi:L-threonylcarbamoyladenylate synthase
MPYTTQTRLVVVDASQPQADVMQAAAAVLLAGGLVAFPTETVYGLGANALDVNAVRRIYSAKGRPAYNPLIVHIAAAEQMAQVAAAVPDVAVRLAARFWPGPLTLVLRRAPPIPPQVSAGRDTVAVRLPAHPVALALIEAAGVPVVAPSANRFTRPSATTAGHVLADLDGHVDLILDGGPTPIGLESTVVDLTGEMPRLLRPGGVTLEALRAALPEIIAQVDDPAQPETAAPASPGMLLRHYSPQAEVLLFSGQRDAVLAHMRAVAAERLAAGQRVGVLALDEDAGAFAGLAVSVQPLGAQADLAAVAQRLFAALRDLDAQGVDVMLARQFAPEGLGWALADRLLRAAEGRVIMVG